MLCPACGAPTSEASTRCAKCGKAQWSSDSKVGTPESLAGDLSTPPEYSSTVRMLIPVGRSPWALLAGYAGLLSVLLVPGPFAIVFGILALRQLRRNPRMHGKGRAIFGIVAGALATIGLVLVWIDKHFK